MFQCPLVYSKWLELRKKYIHAAAAHIPESMTVEIKNTWGVFSTQYGYEWKIDDVAK